MALSCGKTRGRGLDRDWGVRQSPSSVRRILTQESPERYINLQISARKFLLRRMVGICPKSLTFVPLTPGERLVPRSAVFWAASSALPRTMFPHGTPGTRLRYGCSSGLTFLVKDQETEGFAVCNVRRLGICTTCRGKAVASRNSLPCSCRK